MKGKVVIVINLPKKSLAGFESHGMVICETNDTREQWKLLRPPEDAEIGERIYAEGFEFNDVQVADIKGKTMKKCLKLMNIDQDGYPVFDGRKLRCKTGYITASIKNGQLC